MMHGFVLLKWRSDSLWNTATTQLFNCNRMLHWIRSISISSSDQSFVRWSGFVGETSGVLMGNRTICGFVELVWTCVNSFEPNFAQEHELTYLHYRSCGVQSRGQNKDAQTTTHGNKVKCQSYSLNFFFQSK